VPVQTIAVVIQPRHERGFVFSGEQLFAARALKSGQ
jgi:hypothetical protein